MSIFHPFEVAFAWLKKEFKAGEVELAPLVVTIGTTLEAAETSGILNGIAQALDHATGGLSVEINNEVKAETPKIIAAALLVEAPPPATATPADIAAWEQKIATAFKNAPQSAKGQTIDNILAQVYVFLNGVFSPGAAPETYAVILGKLEAAYQAIVNPPAPDTTNS